MYFEKGTFCVSIKFLKRRSKYRMETASGKEWGVGGRWAA
jgi:hypothetical protein